jgi:NADH:ubiquinone oxidoreductase subunit 6 (subunit J)
MNFFTRKTTWTNWELIPLKLAIATIYLLLGAMFWQEVKQYAGIIGILFGITVMISLYLWIKKMKEKQ